MYHIVLTIQLITMIMLLIESWVVFKNMKSALHSWLFLVCISTLVNSLGYYLELTSTTEEAYFTALRLSYFGRVWTPFALLFFNVEFLKLKVSRVLKIVLGLSNLVIYLCVFTTKETQLYYKDMSFSLRGDFPIFVHKDAIVHSLWTVAMLLYAVVIISFLIREISRKSNGIEKKRIIMVMLSMVVQSICAVIEMLDLLPVTEVYDVTMIGFPIGAMFMLIAIFRYKLLDTESLAKDFVNDELAEGVIAIDEKGKIVFSNKTARKLFPDLDARPDEVLTMITSAITSGETLSVGDRIFTPKENNLVQNGVDAGRLYSLIDDTDYIRYTEELEEAKQAADNANKAKSSFLANMSHEIRTPINAVLGMDEMILRESEEQDTLNYAEDIRVAGRTLLSLINDILDFSKIEEGRMEILPVQYELSSVVVDLVNMVRERATKKGLKLVLKVNSEIPNLLYGDEIRIKQIALNLLTNAVKYTEKGEVRFTIDYRRTSDDEIFVSFRVSDTGIGMKEEDMNKLFSPFERIEESRNRSIEGTGLGMSIVKQLLALMESKLDVKSVYGEGSEFSFEVSQKVIGKEPMGNISERFKRTNVQRKAYKELFHAPKADILVVDDTEMNLLVIKNLLKKTQVRIDTAASGQEALASAGRKAYDIIFIDHMMPEMDGIETLHRIRESKDGEAEKTVYVALTANAVSGAREMYLSEGFEDYLSKPVDGNELEEMVMKYLPEDKIEKTDSEDNDGPADDTLKMADEDPLAGLDMIPEINRKSGIANCGSKDGYVSVLETFHRSAEEKAEEIEKYLEAGDIKNLTVKVHALKSSARIIGASQLSEKAAALEEAGKAEDLETIRRDIPVLLSEFRELNGKLSFLDKNVGTGKEITPAMIKEAFSTVCEIAESMDFGMMEDLIRDLREYSFPQEEKEVLDDIAKKLNELDWDGIGKCAKSVLDKN